MTHPERDQDLLLLAHGALPPLKTALTRWHLFRCLDCRRRLDHLQTTSQALAGVIRGPQLPRWAFPIGTASGVAVAWLLALTVLVVILLGTLAVRQHQRAPVSPPAPVGSAPCRPDLPSDRCR